MGRKAGNDFLDDMERGELMVCPLQSRPTDLPMLAVFESIDLGLLSSINQTLSGIAANYMTFQIDPIHEHDVHVYHALGVHMLNLDSLLEGLANALRSDNEDVLERTLKSGEGTVVRPLLDTFSVSKKYVSSTLIIMCFFC
jgi:nucleoporin NUP82